MVCWKEFREDYELISKSVQGRITAKQAKEALVILQKLGLVEKRNGRFAQKEKTLTSRSQGANQEVIQYHRKMIHLGYESLQMPASTRDISGMTMAIPKAKFERIQKRIAEFRDEIQSLVQKPLSGDFEPDEAKTDRIYQLNLQCFELCLANGSDGKK